jgi:hypothetical protein
MLAASVLAIGSEPLAAPNENGVVQPTVGLEKIVLGNFEVSNFNCDSREGAVPVFDAFKFFGTWKENCVFLLRALVRGVLALAPRLLKNGVEGSGRKGCCNTDACYGSSTFTKFSFGTSKSSRVETTLPPTK